MIRLGFMRMVLGMVVAGGPVEEFDLSWHTVDGGGVAQSTGGDLELSGSIGQPDVGILVGADLELSGGFWIALAPTDCNDDGSVDQFDHDAFVACMSGPEGAALSGCECFDVNGSGTIDLADFAAAQTAFTGSVR
jgi:hypothetical protein